MPIHKGELKLLFQHRLQKGKKKPKGVALILDIKGTVTCSSAATSELSVFNKDASALLMLFEYFLSHTIFICNFFSAS